MNSTLCTLCPRKCRALRSAEHGSGFCQMGSYPVVARISPHMWEEPCISGTRGSGTVFFSGCVMKCVFCQNYKISNENFGKILTPQQLADCYKKLEEQNVHNINLVNPTHFVPAIIESLNIYKPKIPIVYNCGGYESVETLELLKDYVDIYLPDVKYADNTVAFRYSKVKNYTEIALQSVGEMLRQQPRNIFDESGILQKGVIIRHLILPSHTKNSIAVLDMLKEHFTAEITVSLMAQYVPCGTAEKFPEINRKITSREYDKVLQHLEAIGFEGYAQERSSAAARYIPDFLLQGIES